MNRSEKEIWVVCGIVGSCTILPIIIQFSEVWQYEHQSYSWCLITDKWYSWFLHHILGFIQDYLHSTPIEALGVLLILWFLITCLVYIFSLPNILFIICLLILCYAVDFYWNLLEVFRGLNWSYPQFAGDFSCRSIYLYNGSPLQIGDFYIWRRPEFDDYVYSFLEYCDYTFKLDKISNCIEWIPEFERWVTFSHHNQFTYEESNRLLDIKFREFFESYIPIPPKPDPWDISQLDEAGLRALDIKLFGDLFAHDR